MDRTQARKWNLQKKLIFLFVLVFITSFPIGLAIEDGTDVSLSVFVKTSKSFTRITRAGLLARIHGVTINGMAVSTTNDSGIPSQSIFIYYKSVSRREGYYRSVPFGVAQLQPLYDSDWLLIDEISTDAQGYYSHVWIPPITGFMNVYEFEVVYQVKVVWEFEGLEVTNFRDIYISPLEDKCAQLKSNLDSTRWFLITTIIIAAVFIASTVYLAVRVRARS